MAKDFELLDPYQEAGPASQASLGRAFEPDSPDDYEEMLRRRGIGFYKDPRTSLPVPNHVPAGADLRQIGDALAESKQMPDLYAQAAQEKQAVKDAKQAAIDQRRFQTEINRPAAIPADALEKMAVAAREAHTTAKTLAKMHDDALSSFDSSPSGLALGKLNAQIAADQKKAGETRMFSKEPTADALAAQSRLTDSDAKRDALAQQRARLKENSDRAKSAADKAEQSYQHWTEQAAHAQQARDEADARWNQSPSPTEQPAAVVQPTQAQLDAPAVEPAVGSVPYDKFRKLYGTDATDNTSLARGYVAAKKRIDEIDQMLPGMTEKGKVPLYQERKALSDVADAHKAKLEAQDSGVGAAPLAAFKQAMVGGFGGVAKGMALADTLLPVPADDSGYQSPEIVQENLRRAARTPEQKMTETLAHPAFQFGKALQEAADQVYPMNDAEKDNLVTKIGEMGGSFIPLLASGAAAPATMGLQTMGDDLETIYQNRVAQGSKPDAAAKFAINRALAGGAVQSLLFEVLPRPLRAGADKYIVDKLARGTVTRLLANRVAQGAEGAVLGAASTAAGNVATGKPISEGVGEGAVGLAAMQALMPRGGRAPKSEEKAPPTTETPPGPAKPGPEKPAEPPEPAVPVDEEMAAEMEKLRTPTEPAKDSQPRAEATSQEEGGTPSEGKPEPAAGPIEKRKGNVMGEPIDKGEGVPIAEQADDPKFPEDARAIVTAAKKTGKIKIFRAVVKGQPIREGDFVGLSEKEVKQYADDPDTEVVSQEVPIDDVHYVRGVGVWPIRYKFGGKMRAKPVPPTWRVAVQEAQGNVPRHVEIARVGPDGERQGTATPDQLAEEGYDVPDLTQLKQGNYSFDQLTQGSSEVERQTHNLEVTDSNSVPAPTSAEEKNNEPKPVQPSPATDEPKPDSEAVEEGDGGGAKETAAPAEEAKTSDDVRAAVKLPSDLAGAKPNYSFGSKRFTLKFESDADKAAYIAAQGTKSKRDGDYVKFASDSTGLDEEGVRAHGIEVRKAIKEIARGADPGELTIPSQRPESDEPKSPSVAPEPKPADDGVKVEATAAQEQAVSKFADKKQLKVQKDFLLDAVKKATADAPDELEYSDEGKADLKALDEKGGAEEVANKYPNPFAVFKGETGKYDANLTLSHAIRSRHADHVTIEVPGDGTFRIPHTKAALTRFSEQIRKGFGKDIGSTEREGYKAKAPTSIPSVKKNPTPKDITDAVSTAASDDPKRDPINRVVKDGPFTLATNGRRMTVAVGGEGEPVGELTVKGEKGDVPVRFPQWQQVVPSDVIKLSKDGFKVAKDIKAKVDTEVDTGEMIRLARMAKLATGEKSNSIRIYKNADGSLGFAGQDPDFGDYQSEGVDIKKQKPVTALDGDYLIDALTEARKLGAEKVRVIAKDDVSPVIVTDGKKFFSVTMPVRLASTPEGTEAGRRGELDLSSPSSFSFRDVSHGELPDGVLNGLKAGEPKPGTSFTPVEIADSGSDSVGRDRGGVRRDVQASSDETPLQSASAPSGATLRRQLERVFGKRITFFRSSKPIDMGAFTSTDRANDVFVNADTSSPFMALTGHEFGHNLKAQRPDLYKSLSKFLDEMYPMPDEYRELKEKTYKLEGQAHDEWISDLIGQRFNEPEFWDEAARIAEKRNKLPAFHALAKAAIDWLNRIRVRASNALHPYVRGDVIDKIDEIRTKIAETLHDYANEGPYDDNPDFAKSSPNSELATPAEPEVTFQDAKYESEEEAMRDHAENGLHDVGETFEEFLNRRLCMGRGARNTFSLR